MHRQTTWQRSPGDCRGCLTETLNRLQRDGLISRAVYPTVPSSVEYALSDLVQSSREPLVAWSAANHDGVKRARQLYDGG